MSVATGGSSVSHQVGSADEVGQDVGINDSLSILLRAGIGSSGSPVGGNVAPELRAPEVEQATHEVGLAKQLVAGSFLPRPVESVNGIDDGAGAGNTHIGIVPRIGKDTVAVRHQMTDGFALRVCTSIATAVGIV